MSGDKIDYPDCYFDIVEISNSLHHLSDIDKTIAEMLRILKPNGKIIINELFLDNQNEKQLTHVYLHHLHADVETILGITHNRTLSKQEIFNIVERNGIHNYSAIAHENETFNKNVNLDRFAQRYKNILDKISDYPQYDKMKTLYDTLYERIYTIGVEFTSQLLIIADKQ